MSEWQDVDEPKVWVSGFLHNSTDLVAFDSRIDGKPLDFIHGFRYLWQLAPPENSPKFLFFEEANNIPPKVTDAFTIIGGLMIISQAFRDVLVQFNIGETQLIEVPIYADENGTPSGSPNHFVLNVHHSRNTLIPELSENIEQPIPYGKTAPPADTAWASVYRKDIWAINHAAIEGADLWHDPMVEGRFFLSSRLKNALHGAGLKIKALDLKPARVFQPA
ncbi:hypothetical protein N9L47_12855 [Rhodobacteraceae bacterium]|nr:hypothetical protein [Paracoccaceae bacterium]